MLIYEYKLDGTKQQYQAIDSAIRVVQFIRNKKQSVDTFPVKQIKRVRIVRRADGFYCQFVVQAERKIAHSPTDRALGIDVGLKAYYTDSDGKTIESQQAARRFCQKAGKRAGVISRFHCLRRLEDTGHDQESPAF